MMRRRFSGKLEHRRVHRGRRVVDEDVDRSAERLDRGGHDARAVVGVGEVGGDHARRVPPNACDAFARSRAGCPARWSCWSSVRATIATSAPSAANRCGGRGADAAARAGDERPSSGEARRSRKHRLRGRPDVVDVVVVEAVVRRQDQALFHHAIGVRQAAARVRGARCP